MSNLKVSSISQWTKHNANMEWRAKGDCRENASSNIQFSQISLPIKARQTLKITSRWEWNIKYNKLNLKCAHSDKDVTSFLLASVLINTNNKEFKLLQNKKIISASLIISASNFSQTTLAMKAAQNLTNTPKANQSVKSLLQPTAAEWWKK